MQNFQNRTLKLTQVDARPKKIHPNREIPPQQNKSRAHQNDTRNIFFLRRRNNALFVNSRQPTTSRITYHPRHCTPLAPCLFAVKHSCSCSQPAPGLSNLWRLARVGGFRCIILSRCLPNRQEDCFRGR